MTKKIEFGFSNDADCLKVAQGTIQSARFIGINHILLHNIFSVNYEVKAFVAQLKKIIFNERGITNVCLCTDSAPFSELTPDRMILIPQEAGNAGNYVNRFAPLYEEAYRSFLQSLIDEINRCVLTSVEVQAFKSRYNVSSIDPKMMSYISWELWQEPNAKKYFWGTFWEFKKWTAIKIDVLKETGRPMYIANFTTSLILDSSYGNKQKWMDWIESDPVFDEQNVYFSHSFYWKNQAGIFDFENNNYPKRPLKTGAITEYNYLASGGKSSEAEMNSPRWMVYFVRLLQGIATHSWPISRIYFFCLLDCNDRDDKGSHAAYLKTAAGYIQKPLWTMIKQAMSVLNDGSGFSYEVIPNGIKGKTQSIIITDTNYSIIANAL